MPVVSKAKVIAHVGLLWFVSKLVAETKAQIEASIPVSRNFDPESPALQRFEAKVWVLRHRMCRATADR